MKESWLTQRGWGLPEAAPQDGDKGQAMGTRDKILTVLPRPGPHASRVLWQQEKQSSQTYISTQTLPSLPLALPSLRERSVPALWLWGQPSSPR